MIKWIKYDKNNPPEYKKEYLISDGKNVDVAWFQNFDDMVKWYPPDTSKMDFDDVTHYALINLPTDKDE